MKIEALLWLSKKTSFESVAIETAGWEDLLYNFYFHLVELKSYLIFLCYLLKISLFYMSIQKVHRIAGKIVRMYSPKKRGSGTVATLHWKISFHFCLEWYDQKGCSRHTRVEEGNQKSHFFVHVECERPLCYFSFRFNLF